MKNALLTIGEFSHLTGIRADNLRFYNRIGLLIPEIRGENGYRYYTRRQLDLAFLISDLRSLGVSLAEIKRYAGERSPKRLLEFFKEQDARVEREIAHLSSIQGLMRIRGGLVADAMGHSEGTPILEEKRGEPIFLCPALEKGIDEEEGLIQAYHYAAVEGIALGCTFGAFFAQDALLSGNFSRPSRYYLRVHEKENSVKPAGRYAAIYGRGDQEPALYGEILAFIAAKGLEIAGGAYEEYPLDELTTQDGELYGVRIEIPVK